ncbi:winged helix-turn-helix domain-containing protein [Aliikangiella sp. G2MR2-5]|uniref:winged helix-turn-helix domain-containing protein n=1 Tax=Aliikangiella sp. G2MR2-5 TaxID=2788943 RepID=UPI0018AB9C9B|nr:winged helix-turn-helix domain-containing protein [Aliikangiella sp. G2MR2-5]
MEVYQSGNLTIYPQTGQVDTAIGKERIGPINMQVLTCLLEQQGKVVSRNELFETIWTNQIVSDDVLTRCISDLRKLLKTHCPSTQFIETLPKRGYRWVPQVEKRELQAPSDEIKGDFFEENSSKYVSQSQFGKAVPEKACLLDSSQVIGSQAKETKQNPFFSWQLMFVGLAAMTLLAIGSLWLADHFLASPTPKVALLPLSYETEELKAIATEVEESLATTIINLSQVQLLSRSALSERPRNPFPYLIREFGTRWILEGRVRHSREGSAKVTLNLVDARSATVISSLSRELSINKPLIDSYVIDFIDNSILSRQVN